MEELVVQPETTKTVAVPQKETPFQKGVTISIIGVSIVFGSLILIALFVKLLGAVFAKGDIAEKKEHPKGDIKEISPEIAPEIVAVIVAALEAGTAKPFIIESIKMDRSFKGVQS